MTRSPRRLVIDIADVLAASPLLARMDAQWLANGYDRTSARLWRCPDGSYTARLVWRDRARALSTITFTVRGVILA